MIDFRYHLVSIVAVFLALAIGIVLGSTSEVRNGALAVLQQTSNQQKNELNAAQAQAANYQRQATAQDQFLQAAEPRLLSKLLDGESVVIVTEPGASGSVVDGVKKAAALAGATVTGEVALQPKFNDISGANQSSLSTVTNSIAIPQGITLPAGSNPQTTDQQQAADLIANAILARSAASTALAPVDPQTLNAYAQAGYLTVSPAQLTSQAQLAVLVTPQSAPAGGTDDPANQVLLAVAQEFATGSSATVVAGDVTGSAQSGSAMSVLRASSVSGQASSVDDADTTLGQITVVQALAALLAGQKPNSYGVSGASAVSPVPVPTPTATATPTQTASPHTTTTGKAGPKK